MLRTVFFITKRYLFIWNNNPVLFIKIADIFVQSK
jgi:hypothetical protein